LRFSDSTWRTWLNPSSNHNRYRLWNYRTAFEACFREVEIEILTREEETFRRIRPYIQPEFVSGKMEEDTVATVRVVVSEPLKV